jgi:hypothetical protein
MIVEIEHLPEPYHCLVRIHQDAVEGFIKPWCAGEAKLLANGCYAAVLDLGNKYVCRISQDFLRKLPEHPAINPRLDSLTIKPEDPENCLSLEIYPKLACYPHDISYKNYEKYEEAKGHAAEVEAELQKANISCWDVYWNNIGRNDAGKYVICDPGCILENGVDGNPINWYQAYHYAHGIDSHPRRNNNYAT